MANNRSNISPSSLDMEASSGIYNVDKEEAGSQGVH
jgi:hypothetical protein